MAWRKSLTSSVRSNRFLLSRESVVVRGHRKFISLEDREMVAVKVNSTAAMLDYTKIIPLGQSGSVNFRRPFSTDFRRMYCSKNQKEIEEQLEKEKEVEARYDQLRKLYNTSQKILLVCVADFDVAQNIALALGDARQILVTSQYGCSELKRMYEDVESQMCVLTKLGVTILFNVDALGFSNDSRVNNTRYHRIVLVSV